MSRRERIALKVGTWAVCLAPMGWLAWRAAAGQLGAAPIEFVTRTLGDWTLRILLASLAVTPVRILTGWSWPIVLRRLLGLFAFAYASLHFSVWIVLDHFFDWPAMLKDVVKRPYITVGMLALTLLLPLVATSTSGMVKRLGARWWRRLHRLAYVVGTLGVIHYLWLVKKGVNAPYWYAVVLAALLGVRAFDWARRRLVRAAAPARPVTGAGGGPAARPAPESEPRLLDTPPGGG